VPGVAVVGAGGVTDEWTAREMLLAGAVAVQVGTATFADPKAPWRVARALSH
jgi:dihydroorotate dehydrogenase (NAD+) catalytic subunit